MAQKGALYQAGIAAAAGYVVERFGGYSPGLVTIASAATSGLADYYATAYLRPKLGFTVNSMQDKALGALAGGAAFWLMKTRVEGDTRTTMVSEMARGAIYAFISNELLPWVSKEKFIDKLVSTGIAEGSLEVDLGGDSYGN